MTALPITKDRLHVVHVVLAMDLGGLERVVMHLLRHGTSLGQRVSLVCLERLGNLSNEIEQLGIPYRCVNKQGGLKLKTIASLREVFTELKPDVVHSHQVGALFYAGPAARRAGVPVVVHTEHGKHYDSAKLKTRLMARWAASYANRFFCVSNDIAESVIKHKVAPRKKVQVVLNGIDTAHFARNFDVSSLRESLKIPLDAPVVGTVANLRRIKRQDVLMRGFAKIKLTAAPAPYLLLVGDGSERGALHKLSVDLDIADRVRFAGSQPDPAPFLKVMDVFALTSESEGMPLSVLEAWAAGRPVVASRVGGLPALITDGQTGLLFDFPDIDALASKLSDLFNDHLLRVRIGQNAAAHVHATLDVSVMANAYDRCYRELGDRLRNIPNQNVRKVASFQRVFRSEQQVGENL